MNKVITAQVGIVGGGLAGLSAAIYLGRAQRDVMVIGDGKSMARWEPDVQNYLGFPRGIGGEDLVQRGRQQARRYGARFHRDHIESAKAERGRFRLQGRRAVYECDRLLLATGIFHIPPELPGVKACLGKTMFFCKDCDGYRLHGRSIAIYGSTNEAVEYALGMLAFSPCVVLVTNGGAVKWDRQHAQWLEEYAIPVYRDRVVNVQRRGPRLQGLVLENRETLAVRALFTVRGDVYHNQLASGLGAKLDPEGQVITDEDCRTSVQGVYAAGCITPANCQMIIAAGQGATAAQAINRNLFEESLHNHSLRRYRERQLKGHRVRPRHMHKNHRGVPVERRVAETTH